MFQTFNANGNMKLILPKVDSLDDIKKEYIQTADCIKTHLEYPNGLILDITQTVSNTGSEVDIQANKEVIQNADGSYSFAD